MPRMSEEQCLAFVTAEPHTAKLATVKADGAPHVAPVWIGLDGREVVFMTREGSVKHKAMAHRNGVPGEILVRVRPTRIAGETGVAD